MGVSKNAVSILLVDKKEAPLIVERNAAAFPLVMAYPAFAIVAKYELAIFDVTTKGKLPIVEIALCEYPEVRKTMLAILSGIRFNYPPVSGLVPIVSTPTLYPAADNCVCNARKPTVILG